MKCIKNKIKSNFDKAAKSYDTVANIQKICAKNLINKLITYFYRSQDNIAKILDVKEYGEFAIVRSTIFMFTIFVGYSLGITATKCIAEFLATDNEKTGKIIEIQDWCKTHPRSGAYVVWDNNKENLYRVGYDGMVL